MGVDVYKCTSCGCTVCEVWVIDYHYFNDIEVDFVDTEELCDDCFHCRVDGGRICGVEEGERETEALNWYEIENGEYDEFGYGLTLKDIETIKSKTTKEIDRLTAKLEKIKQFIP